VTLVLIAWLAESLRAFPRVSCRCFLWFLLGAGCAGEDAESARRRPYLVVLGLTLSFAVFTLFGALILASLHLPGDTIRWLGLALLAPRVTSASARSASPWASPSAPRSRCSPSLLRVAPAISRRRGTCSRSCGGAYDAARRRSSITASQNQPSC
jgi:hypothetical protein